MELTEIFKKSPELIDHPEVKKLIQHCTQQHGKVFMIAKKYQKFHDDVMDKCMYSEVMLINGNDSKEVIKSIFELDNKV